jgi:hypothetical protein
MSRFAALVACAAVFSMPAARAQNAQIPPSAIAPLRFPAGTIVNFQLQTRLKANAADTLDELPKGTLLRVKLLDSIDSAADRDGSAFHGLIVSSVAWGNHVVIHSDAQVRGLFALLRSASRPEGFRYELLVTGLIDRGQSYTLTAFLDPDPSSGTSPTSSQPDSLGPVRN